ncbi:TonB-dependent siderophore receptor [Flavobacterium sp. H122]|uniref:TonB-dependent receptor plug domain-containing protein n=1 Tax=Flavobacterium sp. H122 TaxID=2529860 RepID=UPI0010AB35F1|nr:TonB-dependent receptor plug domain-containing protein [Flavobacterium sp. H122]
MNKKIALVSAFVLASLGVFAQENDSTLNLNEVVISDSKFDLSKEKSGKVIAKITAEDLKKKAGQSVAAVLSTVAGVEINGNQSRNGKDLGIYLRGGRNHQVLILIDGIPVTDASGISLSYDLRLLSVDQIESIEIMKGASSTLYGSGAATGVINITLKKASSKAIAGNAYMNIGTQNVSRQNDFNPKEYNQGLSVNGKLKGFNYFASLNSTESSGISEAKPSNDYTTFEDDNFSRVNSMIKLGFTPGKKLTLDFFADYDRMKNEFDSGSFADNLENFSLSEQYRVGFSPKLKYKKGEFVINSGANVITRDFFNYGSFTYFKSRSVNTDVYNKYQVLDNLFIVTGAQFQFHEMSNESQYASISKETAKFNMIDPYFTAVYNSESGLNINAGARYNIHSKYGNNLVYNINPSFSFKELPLKLIASYSTAFISPSLYQLYSSYGDLKLNPEEDATIEAGFEAELLSEKVKINAVAFYREEENAIGFDLMTYKYYNVEGKNNIRGVETNFEYAVNDKIKFNANYTFSELSKQSRVLNPKQKVNASLDYQATSKLGVNVSYQFVGDRPYEYTVYLPPTWDPVLMKETLKDYQLVNANVRYQLVKDRMNVFGSVDNILDRDFVEVRGFSTRGRNFKVGFNFMF